MDQLEQAVKDAEALAAAAQKKLAEAKAAVPHDCEDQLSWRRLDKKGQTLRCSICNKKLRDFCVRCGDHDGGIVLPCHVGAWSDYYNRSNHTCGLPGKQAELERWRRDDADRKVYEDLPPHPFSQ
jgi:hypothetical protein